MAQIMRTNSDDQDFIELVRFLDADLAERDGNEHAFYAQFNKIDRIKHVVVAYEGERPVGCGAIKEYEPKIMEIKRMYTTPESRGKGIASQVLAELENGRLRCLMKNASLKPEGNNLKPSSFTRRTDIRSSQIMDSMRELKTASVLKKVS